MSDSSETYHEPIKVLSTETQELHRALASLQEELEAVDWYRQRMDACSDPLLRDILAHNMREEVEHACMLLEWLRRHQADFDRNLETYLATGDAGLEAELQEEQPPDDGSDETAESVTASPRLTIGSLKKEAK